MHSTDNTDEKNPEFHTLVSYPCYSCNPWFLFMLRHSSFRGAAPRFLIEDSYRAVVEGLRVLA